MAQEQEALELSELACNCCNGRVGQSAAMQELVAALGGA